MKQWKDRPTMSVIEYARLMGISKSLAFRLAGAGQIPGLMRLGEKRLVIATAAVERQLEQAAAK